MKKEILIVIGGLLLLLLIINFQFITSAFNPPASAPPVGSGAIQTDSSNNVGIGVAPSASYKLNVGGDVNISSGSQYRINGAAIGTGASGWTDTGAVVTLENNGDSVGIGTTAPNEQLDVSKTGGGEIGLTRDDSDGIIGSGDLLGQINFYGDETDAPNQLAVLIQAQADGSWTATTDTPSALIFSTVNDNSGTLSEKMRFSSAGVIFNEQGDNLDFRVEGDTRSNLFFADASADRIGVGATNPSRLLDVASALNTVDAFPELVLKTGSNNINTTFTGLTGDPLGSLLFGGFDRSGGANQENNPQIGAKIDALADESWVDGEAGTDLVFYTTPINTNTPLERIRIDSGGNIGIGAAPASTVKLNVSGDVGANNISGFKWTPVSLIATDVASPGPSDYSDRHTQKGSYIGQFPSFDINYPVFCTYNSSTRTCIYNIPTSIVPATAKEVLLYFYFAQDQNITGGVRRKGEFRAYTTDGTSEYSTYFYAVDHQNDRAHNSLTEWLPYANGQLFVQRIQTYNVISYNYLDNIFGSTNSANFNAIHVIGYR